MQLSWKSKRSLAMGSLEWMVYQSVKKIRKLYRLVAWSKQKLSPPGSRGWMSKTKVSAGLFLSWRLPPWITNTYPPRVPSHSLFSLCSIPKESFSYQDTSPIAWGYHFMVALKLHCLVKGLTRARQMLYHCTVSSAQKQNLQAAPDSLHCLHVQS